MAGQKESRRGWKDPAKKHLIVATHHGTANMAGQGSEKRKEGMVEETGAKIRRQGSLWLILIGKRARCGG